MTIKKKTGGH